MIKLWWSEAEKHNVLPLDDRFGPRFAENAARFHGARNKFIFHAGMGHVPTDVAPDVRSRSYTIEAHVEIGERGAEGVLIAHGDATSGYSLYIKDGLLVHDLNIGGGHEIVTSNRKVPSGAHRLGVHVERLVRKEPPAKGSRTGVTEYTLLIDGEPAGAIQTQLGFNNFISWSGLDIGRDRSSPVSHYEAPFEFTGQLLQGDGRHARRPEARRRGGRGCGDGAAVASPVQPALSIDRAGGAIQEASRLQADEIEAVSGVLDIRACEGYDIAFMAYCPCPTLYTRRTAPPSTGIAAPLM